MPKPINNKCLECSKISRHSISKTKPDCYVVAVCPRRRGYYRQLEFYRAKARQYHRYLKFLGDKCFVCGSIKDLQAHHIQSQARCGPDNQSNIVTLCNTCHKIITIYTRRLGIERELL